MSAPPTLFTIGAPARTLRPLHPHQEASIEALRQSLKNGHRRPLLQAPTGFGKTLTAAHVIKMALDKGAERVAFTVPALSLIDQTVDAFEVEGLGPIGVIQGSHPRADPDAPIQVASVQTLARRAFPDVGLVIVDEAHLMHEAIFDWMAERPALIFVGLSATPWARGLGKPGRYDDLIVAALTGDLIKAGYLSDFVAFAPTEPDLSGVSTFAGDYHERQLAEACDRPELVGDVIETWLARGENRPTLCYGVDRAHALHLQQRFAEAGIAAAYIDCNTPRGDRERIFEQFRAGAVRAICNVATLTVGIDLDVRCIIDARPTKSEMRFVQTIGRGLRTAPGKDKLIILDHAGNHLRLGTVTDIHHSRLDGGMPRQAAPEAAERRPALPVKCESCAAIMPRGALACGACGHERESKSAIVHADGELVELGSSAAGRGDTTIDDKASFFGELKGFATIRGYASGWAANKYRERFGVWPNDPRVRHAEPRPPSLKTGAWIRSRQIAYAKARRHHG